MIVAAIVLQHLLIVSLTVPKTSAQPFIADPAPSVIINKYQNSGTAADTLELLIIQNNLDLRGMIIKDFSSSMASDGGGKYRFNNIPFWSNVPAGTLIVLRNNQSAADVIAGNGDFNLDLGLQNTAYFTNLGGAFDIATTDMVMIKAAGSDSSGVVGSLHALAGGTAGAQFTAAPAPKLRAAGTSGTLQFVFANNSTQSVSDFNGTDATGAATGLAFGAGNNANNTAFINSLRTSGPTSTNPAGGGSASPAAVQPGENTTLTVTVTPGTNPASGGISVTADLTAIGGSAANSFTGNGNAFTLQAMVAAGTEPGVKTLPFTVSDAQNRSSTGSIDLTVNSPVAVADHLVISQIYGGGGNLGAAYQNDYVELYNPTSTIVNLTGWSLQYASGTGSGWDAGKQLLGGGIGPGEYYLVALASGGADGSLLPPANVSGDVNMGAAAGKIALVNNSDSLVGNCPLSDPNLVDFVGYGATADCREGSLNASAPSSTAALFRKNGGITDTNNNNTDFTIAQPAPRRTALIVEIGPSVSGTDPRSNGTNAPRDASLSINFSEPVTVDADWFLINCAATGAHQDAQVLGSGKRYLVTPNTSFTSGEQCTATIRKNGVHDVDTDDAGPDTDTLLSDYTWSFTTSTGTPPPYSAEVHLALGNPSNAAPDVNQPLNYLMQKPEFALSYNRDRGTPNWVSWHLDESWTGSLTRVDSFRPDPAVPAAWYRVQATDYSGSGFDRGHLTPNADRDKETAVPINQATFLMSNMLPQAPDNNQGPWANLENYLRTLLPANNEIYIVAGGHGTGGTGSTGFAATIANGRVTVPAKTWKVALIIPRAEGDDVWRTTAAARTIAVIMPNEQGIRNVDWRNYLVSVDQVETLTGYNFFSNLPDAVENSIEAGVDGNNPPGTAGQTVDMEEDRPASITLDAASPSGNQLTYTVLNQPAHGTISANSGRALVYTPNPNYNGPDSFTFKASDGARDSNVSIVQINVAAVNDAPVLAAIGNQSVNERTALNFTARALDSADNPGNNLTYGLVGAPAGATIDSISGIFSWTPTEAQGTGGTYTFTVKVTDDGAPALSDEETIVVTVNEINSAPVLPNIPGQTGMWGTAFQFFAAASDEDQPANTLTYSLVNAPAEASIDPASGAFSWTPDRTQTGTSTFRVRVADNGLPQLSDEKSVTITVGKRPTAILYTGDASEQYSDRQALTAALTDAGTGALHNTAVAGKTVKFTIGAQSTSVATDAGGQAATFLNLTQDPAPVVAIATAFAGDDYYLPSSDNDSFDVLPEDARVYYTGMTFVNTACATCNDASTTLSATVRDITAESMDAVTDVFPGDVRGARVTFVNREAGNAPLAGCTDLPVQLVVNSTDTKTGTVTCNWTANIGNNDSDSFTVGIVVSNYYNRNASIDDQIITVSKPLGTNFVTGGGFLTLTGSSAGLYAGGLGTKSNFGFNVKYNSSGRNLQGKVNVIFRTTGGRTYQIKGNQIDSLSINNSNPNARTAVYTGKANLTDITDPLAPLSLGGGHSFQLQLTDRGEGGVTDSIGIALYANAGGALLFSSNWDGTKTIEQNLAGGNLVVR